jgi:flagellar biosynthesis protein FliQ
VKQSLKKAVLDWLQQEQAGSEQGSEQALRQAMSRLPGSPMPVGFAERVLVAAGIAPQTERTALQSPFWALRFTLAVSLLLSGLAAVLVPSLLQPTLGLLQPARLVGVILGGLVAFFQRLGAGLAYWRDLAEAGAVVASVFSSPTFLGAMAVGVLVSLIAFRLLQGVIDSERSARYVRSI